VNALHLQSVHQNLNLNSEHHYNEILVSLVESG
jgi:hypothetical protein